MMKIWNQYQPCNTPAIKLPIEILRRSAKYTSKSTRRGALMHILDRYIQFHFFIFCAFDIYWINSKPYFNFMPSILICNLTFYWQTFAVDCSYCSFTYFRTVDIFTTPVGVYEVQFCPLSNISVIYNGWCQSPNNATLEISQATRIVVATSCRIQKKRTGTIQFH